VPPLSTSAASGRQCDGIGTLENDSISGFAMPPAIRTVPGATSRCGVVGSECASHLFIFGDAPRFDQLARRVRRYAIPDDRTPADRR